MSGEYRNNHYVPVWYQKRFVPDPTSDHELYYLSLKQPKFTDSEGKVHFGKAVRKLGFRHCFAEKDLYTTNLGGVESRDIERLFFGNIDIRGQNAVNWFAEFSHPWDGTDSIKVRHLSGTEVVRDAHTLYERWFDLPLDDRRAIVETLVERIEVADREVTIELYDAAPVASEDPDPPSHPLFGQNAVTSPRAPPGLKSAGRSPGFSPTPEGLPQRSPG